MSRSAPAHFDLDRLIAETSVQHVEYHPTLPSTSTTALELLQPLLDVSPALVLTSEQTAGRGRKGNVWWSSGGALTFTLVVNAGELPMAPERRPMVSLAAGLAVRDALKTHAPEQEFALKWPNDVLSGEQKICGILVEQHSHGNRQGILVGIGVNVNNSLSGAPAEVAQRATSLFNLQGKSFDLTSILIEILQRLDFRISQLNTHPRLALSEVNRHNMLTGRTVTLQLADQTVTGVCIGIDDEGQLVLQTEDKLHRCSSGIVLQW
ncbi:MAG: biotin--[acetyl-CoA-carboxylase] ligase [Planctomycetota bacterium]|nr:MAG: biotin--[acetyl-CoA-carboxylase] ligase [Planctomycetota bacterium]